MPPVVSDRRIPQLRVPGVLHRRLVEHAMVVVERGDEYEMDLANAVSLARVGKKGRGFQAFIPLDPDQIDRLAMWVKPAERDSFYRAADNLREQMGVA